MASERLRLAIVCEDVRTERFVRALLRAHGFESRELTFVVPPRGGKTGSGEAWVRKQYAGEVRKLRSRVNHQRLGLIAVRDGDNLGIRARKADLDVALAEVGHPTRGPDDAIALPVPTWSIENWLLHLLGDAVDESRHNGAGQPWKQVFDHAHRDDESAALRTAAEAWRGSSGLPSLEDAHQELQRVGL